jgi:hypothetical protein
LLLHIQRFDERREQNVCIEKKTLTQFFII